MPADSFKRVNLDYLMPELRDRLFEVIARCASKGQRYVATHGYRSYQEQMGLWKAGRVVPGRVVTNAKGGESQHNFGLAVDFVRDLDPATGKVEPSWLESDYSLLVSELQRAGLHSGIGYKDAPHAGWGTFYDGKALKALDKIWKLSTGTEIERLSQVWQYVLAKSPALPDYRE